MELARKENQSTAVGKVSQNAIVRTLSVKRFDQVANQLPTKIQGTFELPKIHEMILATDEKTVQAFIEFELIKLAERINVSGNLTDPQVEFIAGQLVRMFPNETIADFKLCFERAAMGAYGKIFKLDGVEIGIWMKGLRDEKGEVKQAGYLDEKYQVLEAELMREKDNIYRPIPKAEFTTSEKHQEWLDKLKEAVAKVGHTGRVPKLTPAEYRKEGKEKRPPANPNYDNGMTERDYHNKRVLQQAAAKFYKGRTSLKLDTFVVDGYEIKAESESDAKQIFEMVK